MTRTIDIDVQTTLARSASVLYSDIDGDVSLMSIETGKYYGLADVAGRIWSLLERPLCPSQICDMLMVEYRVDRERCEAEVMRVLRHMASEGVVEQVTTQP